VSLKIRWCPDGYGRSFPMPSHDTPIRAGVGVSLYVDHDVLAVVDAQG
jgi:hypothetical protein